MSSGAPPHSPRAPSRAPSPPWPTAPPYEATHLPCGRKQPPCARPAHDRTDTLTQQHTQKSLVCDIRLGIIVEQWRNRGPCPARARISSPRLPLFASTFPIAKRHFQQW
eukprot:3581854-Prymnesium_polylepis.1